jgi:SAM-dependent methyltransferase
MNASRPAPSPAAAFFDAIAASYDRDYALSGPESRARMDRVLGVLGTAPLRILDLGVGTGRELPHLLDAGHTPVGLDASRAMLDRCARRARRVTLVQADFWCASAHAPLPFDDASFDAAIALHGTLAHPPDVGAVCGLAAELARVVRPGGHFVAEVPAPAWLDWTAAHPPPRERGVRRTGPLTAVIEDRRRGASIEARLLEWPEWEGAFGPAWRLRRDPVGPLEWLLVAERAR